MRGSGAYVAVFLVSVLVGSARARRSPNADDVLEYFSKGSGAGRYSNDIIEDGLLDVPGLITKYGYPVEVHNVITDDGYILELHRIPHGRDQNNDPGVSRPAVLVQHGLFSSSADFVIMGPGTALAYILAEAGFDVWLGNNRGNYYSRRHVTLNPDFISTRAAFWRFSWEQMGSLDLPAMIDLILRTTGRSNLHYIGHSQGTTVFFAMGTLRPEYNAKIASMQAFAPVAYMEHNENILFVTLGPAANNLKALLNFAGVHSFLSYREFYGLMGRLFCADGVPTQIICSNFIFIIADSRPDYHNATMLPAKLGHAPAGASVRQIVHYGQHIGESFFRRYNHGLLGNWGEYQSFTPPSMDLSLITAPVYLHYAEFDHFSALQDVDRLWRELGNPKEKIRVPSAAFGHIDFMWGTKAKELLYDRTIDIMMSIENSQL